MNDWRLSGQEAYLKGIGLTWQTWYSNRQGWEHDHCEFCGQKFSLQPEDMNEGFATADGYHWVCRTCFDDFREMFGWST